MAGMGTPICWAGYNGNARPVCKTGYNGNATPVCEAGYNSNATPVCLTGCFPSKELIWIKPDEYIHIGSVKKGDKILSWDTINKKPLFTEVTNIHKYSVNEIMLFNNALQVSSSHPILTVEKLFCGEILVQKWKPSINVNVGEYIVGLDGQLVEIKTKSRHWYEKGMDVLNLSTDNELPFLVANCVVRAENATDMVEWHNGMVSERLVS